ncbi:MAG: SDR family oxidoreductase [Fibrobacteres bacterium]|nr:SDR family oxidoreductase [Fibrobacterota bacterium]
MAMRKAGKTALVTGSAKRLGRVIALRLAAEGYFTWVHYLSSRDEAAEVLETIRSAGGDGALVKGDVASSKQVAAMAERLRNDSGRLDLLVNNVGVYRTGDLASFPVQDFAATLRTNLVGAFDLIQGTLDLFPETGGSVVNIGYAGVGSLAGSTHNTAYLISKTGMLVLTKSLAQALGPRGIRVNMVSPGILDNSVELPRRTRDYVPLDRLGRCDDVAEAVAFLASGKASYITGVNLDVAGGYMLGLKEIEDFKRS